MIRGLLTAVIVFAITFNASAQGQSPQPPAIPIIFDTDIGNDVDDALALGVIHALQSRGECRLIAVTITKDHEECAPFVDAINTFYGRGNIPLGVVKNGVTPERSKFNLLANQQDSGRPRYPHKIQSGNEAPDAIQVLRRALAKESDGSVVIAQVGFSTNLARLLESAPDRISPLSGVDLVKRKVRLLSIMAGAFTPIDGKPFLEYNVVQDLKSSRALAEKWPTPIVWSGFEIGVNIPYPAASILNDYRYVAHHPLSEAYILYEPPPHNRPTWDLTSVLYGIRPGLGYFDLSAPGRVAVNEKGVTTFTATPNGRDRYLIAKPEQRVRVTEALVQLASQPPNSKMKR